MLVVKLFSLALEHHIIGVSIATRANASLAAYATKNLKFRIQNVIKFATEFRLYCVHFVQ
jgi:hypothetical protein